MITQAQKVDVLSILSVSSMLIENLPELPGFNGSVLTIDDEEARKIASELDVAREVVDQLIKALTWAVDNPADDAYWIAQARSALSRIGGAS